MKDVSPTETYLCDEVPANIWIELLQQVAGVFGSETANVLLLKEEVDTQVRPVNNSGVLYCEISDP